MQTLKGAWAGLDNLGRIVLIAAITIVVVVAIVFGLDLTPYITGLFS